MVGPRGGATRLADVRPRTTSKAPPHAHNRATVCNRTSPGGSGLPHTPPAAAAGATGKRPVDWNVAPLSRGTSPRLFYLVPPERPPAMIVVDSLVKEFRDLKRGRIRAVDRVSFTAKPGEIYGLLGPNGAGKTTCLRVLSTVLQPTSGTAEVAGFDVVENPEAVRKSIGFMSNNTDIYDRMTAREIVIHFGRLYGMPKRRLDDRVDEIFDLLMMDDFRETLCGKLSTGQRQKVSIARTIVHDPPVLIFDEPTTGLDVLVARTVLKVVQRLREAGKCIIFSTHIMREVERLCDRIGIIHRGRILAEGTVEELKTQYGQPDIEEMFFDVIRREDPAAVPELPPI